MEAALQSRMSAVRGFATRAEQRLAYETSTIARLTAKIKQLEDEKTQLVKAVGLIDRAIQVISANGIGKIESIVTAGLRLAFDDPHMGLIVEKKEGTRGSSYRLLIACGDVVGESMKSFGGGITNVAAFLLRVILIKRFKLAKFIALDESFNNVNGAGNQRRVSELLKKLCNDHKFTILAVTGQSILTSAADHVYQVSVEKGVSVLRKVEAEELDGLRQDTYSAQTA